eukprot:2155790-Rhodomonas_salina.4
MAVMGHRSRQQPKQTPESEEPLSRATSAISQKSQDRIQREASNTAPGPLPVVRYDPDPSSGAYIMVGLPLGGA